MTRLGGGVHLRDTAHRHHRSAHRDRSRHRAVPFPDTGRQDPGRLRHLQPGTGARGGAACARGGGGQRPGPRGGPRRRSVSRGETEGGRAEGLSRASAAGPPQVTSSPFPRHTSHHWRKRRNLHLHCKFRRNASGEACHKRKRGNLHSYCRFLRKRHCRGMLPGISASTRAPLGVTGAGRRARPPRLTRYLCTRPEPDPAINALTSDTLRSGRSPEIECFRQEQATANSSASCAVARWDSP